jgi:predicted  nucleic acid-binding Zn ribbon protein
MDTFKYFILILLLGLISSQSFETVMNEEDLRGLLDTMTVHQLEVIDHEVLSYIEEKHKHLIKVSFEKDAQHHDEKIKYIDNIIDKVKKNSELFDINNFGMILERISDVLEEDEGDNENFNFGH